MTPDERRAALVERVGKLLWYDGSGFDVPNHLLTAAIDLIRAEVLEESARECGLSSVGLHFAAAIRELKGTT